MTDQKSLIEQSEREFFLALAKLADCITTKRAWLKNYDRIIRKEWEKADR